MEYLVAYLIIGMVLGWFISRPHHSWVLWIPLWLPFLIILLGQWIDADPRVRSEEQDHGRDA